MAKDLSDMSRVLSSKLESSFQTLFENNTLVRGGVPVPDAWRALVKLYMLKCVDMDQSATAVDPSSRGSSSTKRSPSTSATSAQALLLPTVV